MGELLKKGQTVQALISGYTCKVEEFLGGGGQGEVYKAILKGKPLALKWYFRNTATTGQKKIIEQLIKTGAPTKKFLWPMDLTVADNTEGFGYIMPLRPSKYKSIIDLMKRKIEPSFSVLATAGLKLADSFLQLHAKGMCYRDISFGNVFFEADTGEILICDNDNVTIDSSVASGVLGTPRFMAPEVVRAQARPDTNTDLYSLAVLLFYMFMMHHPLEGKKEAAIKCMDLPAMNKLYGYEPVFIFNTDNASNRPVPGYHDNAIEFWKIYPEFFKNLFMKSFTTGIKDPINGRVRESEWRGAMVRLKDSIIYCSCGAENFYDSTRASQGYTKCWACNGKAPFPPRICIDNNIIMLNYNTKLYPHHIDKSCLYDFSEVSGQMNQHPTNERIWGIKNLTDEKWVITTPEHSVKDVEPGKSVPISQGLKINFGKTSGEIRYTE